MQTMSWNMERYFGWVKHPDGEAIQSNGKGESYANAKGGKLYIGVNDDGYVVGLEDAYYLLDVLPNQIADTMGIMVEIDHEIVYERGVNLKYHSIPEDISQKPENLYVRGILTKEAIEDIDITPKETKNVTPAVQALFNAAPGFVKQLRKNKEYRAKVKADIDMWIAQDLVNIDTDGALEYMIITCPLILMASPTIIITSPDLAVQRGN